ncbi:hypothetical protein IP86_10750 [Rhodopseudomonas sp. AAP120]|uniref:DUF4376 domain-containing protein n=1 Tax=Rhodopseudomonas sp. AAP120 TaxID=1523430 RepID=UPI0006B9141E|nr:DUF4376 domain-containing protein [Rhodopseudomonas sp. AAP120]KPF98801.1 hypothetical protein IP86_10750 [Rhodopseudomonas sp. AAP120]
MKLVDGLMIPLTADDLAQCAIDTAASDARATLELVAHAMTRRDELIDGGVTFDGVVYQTRPTDRENIIGAALMASLALAAGAQPGNYRWSDPNADFEWIAMDNSKVLMDAPTVIELGKAQAARKQELIFKARWIKDQIGIGIITTTAQVDATFS